jgi:outer membrane lipoprotein-sorting protein
VGSDFTYEDVSGRDLGADAYKLLREEAMAGRDCYVVESDPKTPSAFSRKVSWVDKTSFLPVKEEYYDVQNELFRVFTADEVKEIEGHPTAVRRTMKNLKTGHYTEVVFENVDYDAGLEEGLFSERSLQSPPARWIQ